MKDQHRKWQDQWYEIMGESKSSMQEDIACDTTLQFKIWELDSGKQEDCFEILPSGNAVLARALEVLAASSPRASSIDDDGLIELLERMTSDTESVLDQARDGMAAEYKEAIASCARPGVVRGDEKLRKTLMSDAASPTEMLDDIFGSLIEERRSSDEYAAYFFLREPIYQTAQDTVVRNWALWPLLAGEFDRDPYEAVFELYKNAAKAVWTESELFVFAHDRKSTSSD